MSRRSIREGIELFHLQLLSFLGKKLDKRCYALKGGCNLRFFFGSPRYSEDMDLDIAGIPVHGLHDTVGAILKSRPFVQALRVADISIEHITEHKQTETTQRWKLGLWMPDSGQPVPTKVEFSRRGLRGATVLSTVDSVLVHRYGLPPVMTPHYTAEAALLQKIEALAGRSVTQARDILDLHLLLSRERMRQILPLLPAATLDKAKAHAPDLSFDDFKGQVVAYLHPDDQAAYDSRQVWDAIQLGVLEMLEGGA